ncbi:MAG: hypothetical protein ACWIPJ_10985 [Polaribacter sp.]
MQKGISVIKDKFIIFYILLSVANGFSQTKIEGEYCMYYKTKDYSTCLSFNNGFFEYIHSGHVASDYGEGTYFINKNSLTINFNKIKSNNFSKYKILNSYKTCKDSIQLKFIVKDKEGILQYPYNGTVEIENGVYKILGKKGIISLKNSSQDSIRIRLRNLSFDSLDIKLKSGRNYTIEVFLSEFSGNPIKNKKIFYTIEKINDSILILNNNGIKSIWKNTNHVYKK